MSVYIPGISMPKSCCDCPMSGLLCCVLMPGVPSMWAEYNDAIREDRLHSDCPLIPVPDHGRLIDGDALREDWLENGENEYVYDTNAFLDSLDDAPTIIPASEEGTGNE